MTNEDSVLEEAIANLREAAQKVRATQNLMHSLGDDRRRELPGAPDAPLYGAGYDRGGLRSGLEEAASIFLTFY